MLFQYKDASIDIPEGRLEVCRLKAKFDAFAEGMRGEVMKSFDEKFEDMRAFLDGGDEWAHDFIDRGADLVIRELAALDCYDIDRETWVEKYIDYSLWEAGIKPFRQMAAELDAEEAEKEKARAARTEDWGNTLGEHKTVISQDEDGNVEARDSLDGGNIVTNLGLSAASGLFNMIGRGMSKSAIDKKLKEAFESAAFRNGIENGILDSVANAYAAFIDYCMKNGTKTDYIPITKEDAEKANRIVNNLERNLIPPEKVNGMIANAFATDPFASRLYRMLLLKGEDKDGSLTKIADFFLFHKLNVIRKNIILEECATPTITLNETEAAEFRALGEQVITTEAELAAYKGKYAEIANNLQLPASEQQQVLAQLDQDFANAQEEERKRVEEEEREQREEAEKQARRQQELEQLANNVRQGMRRLVKNAFSGPLWLGNKLLEKIIGKDKVPLLTVEIPAELSEENQHAIRNSMVTSLQANGYNIMEDEGNTRLTRDTPLDSFDGTFTLTPLASGTGYSLTLTGKSSYSLLLGILSWVVLIISVFLANEIHAICYLLMVLLPIYWFFSRKKLTEKIFHAAAVQQSGSNSADSKDAVMQVDNGPAAKLWTPIKKVFSKVGDKADALYNKLPLDKINEKLHGKVDVKSRKFKLILSGVLCLLLIIIGSCLFGGKKKSPRVLPSQLRKAAAFVYEKYSVPLSVEWGGILEPKIPRESVKYRETDEIGANEICEEAGISGKKGKIFDAIAIFPGTTTNEQHKLPVVIIISGSKVVCMPQSEYY